MTQVLLVIIAIALILIFLVLLNKLVSSRRATQGDGEGGNKSDAPMDEIHAAIAAAIHLYNQELHDEEPTVITIQKTERSWTPWNAKYLSMNHYFTNRHF